VASDNGQVARDSALAALDAGRTDDAYTWLRTALAATVDLEGINDLAVLAYRLGQTENAQTLLRAVLAIEPERADATTNLAAIAGARATRNWRQSQTLGGPDPGMYERAFPGMPRPDIISEHCSRYAYALSLVGGAHVLDLGCGTGYGSEMLSWAAASVRGFDLWLPRPEERPSWPGVQQLNYGHDLTADPLPRADIAVMFEVIEHLPDAPRALEIAWGAVDVIIGSFPNPVHHGSWMNQYHINDWTLVQFERELEQAAIAAGHGGVELTHIHQNLCSPLLTEGRDPASSYWVLTARATASHARRHPPAPAISAQPPLENLGTQSPVTALKEVHELAYWQERKRVEGELANADYVELFTDHVGLLPEFYAGKSVLDIGCGPRGSLEWASMAARRVGLDPLAGSYAKLRSVAHAMEYVAAPAERMPFADTTFDVVTSFNSLDHVEDLAQTVAEIKRILKPGGTFALLTDVNHGATPCEPQCFSWDIVDRFFPELELEFEARYEKNPSSMLESLRERRPYDDSLTERRYAVLAATFVKRTSPAGAVSLDTVATPTIENSIPPTVRVDPDTPIRDYWRARVRQVWGRRKFLLRRQP
jgi:ubiquinone/menaquinone biosynthesis C-methylase UbiE